MELYTIQMSQWRKAKALEIELVDITVKSGSPVFAPTWEIVQLIKRPVGPVELAQAEYEQIYRVLMRNSYKALPEAWKAILDKPKVALACYCKAGEFCHRRLLVEYLQGVGKQLDIVVDYKGELV